MAVILDFPVGVQIFQCPDCETPLEAMVGPEVDGKPSIGDLLCPACEDTFMVVDGVLQ